MLLIGRLRGLSRGARWTCIGLLVLAVTFAAWLGFDAFQAKSNLEQARTSAEQSKDALLSGKPEEATRFAEMAQFHARQAQTATHSLPWTAAAAVPILGSPLKTMQQICDVVVGLADNILLPGAKMGAGLSPEKLFDGTRLELEILRAEQPRLTELAAAAAKLDSQAQAISNPAYLSLIRDARGQLQDQTSKLAQLLGNTSIAAQLAPSMLGANGPRTYLMVFQNNAEARGTGGLLGGFGVLRFDNGMPVVDAVAPNTELKGASAAIDLGSEFNSAYGWVNPLSDFRNSNLSPHFPYAAQIWKSMWEQQSQVHIDGVITVDPVALSYLLGALGPVTLPDGELINQENVVELTQSIAYTRFAPGDQAPEGISDVDLEWYNRQSEYNRAWYRKDRASVQRKQYLQQIATAVVSKLIDSPPAPRKLIEALGKGVEEGRIAVWSATPADQKILEETSLAHAVPDDDAPYAQVTINNLAGNKLDYYLRREIEYAADGCDGERRNATITVRMANLAPVSGLPADVGSAVGISPEINLRAPEGTMISSVRVLATKGSTLMSVTVDGERTSAVIRTENGRPSFEVQIAIPPGKSGELQFRLSEPTSPGEARVPIQPLIDNVSPIISVPACP